MAGRKRSISWEVRGGREEMFGGAETRPTCRNSMVKMVGKKIAGAVVKMERRAVKIVVTARRGQRRSVTQEEGTLGMKTKDLGKEGEKGKEVIPFRVVLGKSLWVPLRETTPQPPRLEMTPAWRAAWQMNESPR